MNTVCSPQAAHLDIYIILFFLLLGWPFVAVSSLRLKRQWLLFETESLHMALESLLMARVHAGCKQAGLPEHDLHQSWASMLCPGACYAPPHAIITSAAYHACSHWRNGRQGRFIAEEQGPKTAQWKSMFKLQRTLGGIKCM